MIRLLLFIFFCVFALEQMHSQSCLPEGYVFSTQAKIDSFQVNYPGCTEIEGDVYFNTPDIWSLAPLNVLTSIGGNLTFNNASGLHNFNGLNNLTSVWGDFTIGNLESITSLAGLENLTTVGGNFQIGACPQLNNLTGLTSLSYVGGNLELHGYLTSLEGLNNPDYIGGKLILRFLHVLTDLDGLETWTAIHGGIEIMQNNALVSLAGLDNITSISGTLSLNECPVLVDLTALSNLTLAGGDLFVNSNQVLTSLTGLENLTSLGGSIIIKSNPSLVDLDGLSGLTSINGNIDIANNGLVGSLAGLGNIDASSIQDLIVHHNNSLSSSDAPSICDYLESPNGSVNIYLNAPGCNNPQEIADACDILLPCLPFGNFYLLTQTEIDRFQEYFGDCNVLGGNVIISGEDISNLNGLLLVDTVAGDLSIGDEDFGGNPSLVSLAGLDSLNHVGGALYIQVNESITNLAGLDGLNSVGKYLWITDNDSLQDLTGLNALSNVALGISISHNVTLNSLTGLDGLSVIDNYLSINWNNTLIDLLGLDSLHAINGDLEIYSNEALINMSGLEGLTSINGHLLIYFNDALQSLTGLDNIEAGSIQNLNIHWNGYLSWCAIQSICEYLASPTGIVSIYENRWGCQSSQQILLACDVSVNEETLDIPYSIYPNPTSGYLIVERPEISNSADLIIFTINGQVILEKILLEASTSIDMSGFPSGIYFLKIIGDKVVQVEKVIKN